VIHHAASRHRLVDRLLHQGDAFFHPSGLRVGIPQDGGDVGEPGGELPRAAQIEGLLQLGDTARKLRRMMDEVEARGVVGHDERERLIGPACDA
jgi:hypothetical protein